MMSFGSIGILWIHRKDKGLYGHLFKAARMSESLSDVLWCLNSEKMKKFLKRAIGIIAMNIASELGLNKNILRMLKVWPWYFQV